MRWLFLDTHVRGQAVFGWLAEEKAAVWTYEGRGNGLLSALARRCAPRDIAAAQGICVVSGPGPFSAIRIGVLVANLMARTFGLPLHAVAADQAVDLQKLAASLARQEVPAVQYAAPVYDSEPNITLPKT